MDDTILKIALAGLMHDIGKFAERAGFEANAEFLNNNAGLYQPYIESQKRHSHRHAVYTAAFLDYFNEHLPSQLSKASWGLGDTFANLAAGHHKPETPLQWIIAMADRISSGFDRQQFEEYNKSIPIKDYKKTRLLSIFEQVDPDKNNTDSPGLNKPDLKYRYRLKALSPDSIFPEEASVETAQSAEEEYQELLLGFKESLSRIAHKRENISLWYEHFDSLLCNYISHIPAATVGNVIHDVSLYDHSRATAAIAAALYRYHVDSGSLNTEDIKDYFPKKFLIISADFYGIQDFIFSEGGESAKGRAKMLRGRSFMVSLFSELAAHYFCDLLQLPVTSVLLNAAGKFTIICHNTPEARKSVLAAKERINQWLFDRFYGENSIGVSLVEAAPTDFANNKNKCFSDLWEKLGRKVEREKYNRIDLNKYGGAVTGYLESFDSNLDQSLCHYCGKRPSTVKAMIATEVEGKNSCNICKDQKFLGENIVKRNRLAITTVDADIKGSTEKLTEPIFGRYQVCFTTGLLNELARDNSLLRYWQISERNADSDSGVITQKYIGGYVPVYTEEDLMDDRLVAGRKSDARKEEMIDQVKEGVPKTFHHLACKARVFSSGNDKKSSGIEALGILKADVDNLGLVFSCGLPKKQLTLSRLATMSRQMNAFFSMYVPHCLKSKPEFSNIYTVFAGGDDLFLVGPWNSITDFASKLNDKFRAYTCHNKNITISAGISLHKPGEPLKTFYELSELALETSKNTKGKNCLTVFGETVGWDELQKLIEIQNRLKHWLNDEVISKGMLYKFNHFQDMADRERRIKDIKGGITIDDVEACLWRPRFKYSVVRNVDKELEGKEKRQAIQDVMKATEWFDKYGGKIKIPLWRILYEMR